MQSNFENIGYKIIKIPILLTSGIAIILSLIEEYKLFFRLFLHIFKPLFERRSHNFCVWLDLKYWGANEHQVQHYKNINNALVIN